MHAEDRPRRPIRWTQRTRLSVRPSSRTSSAVPSGNRRRRRSLPTNTRRVPPPIGAPARRCCCPRRMWERRRRAPRRGRVTATRPPVVQWKRFPPPSEAHPICVGCGILLGQESGRSSLSRRGATPLTPPAVPVALRACRISLTRVRASSRRRPEAGPQIERSPIPGTECRSIRSYPLALRSHGRHRDASAFVPPTAYEYRGDLRETASIKCEESVKKL